MKSHWHFQLLSESDDDEINANGTRRASLRVIVTDFEAFKSDSLGHTLMRVIKCAERPWKAKAPVIGDFLVGNFVFRVPARCDVRFPCAKFMDTFHLHIVFGRFIYTFHVHITCSTSTFQLHVSLACTHFMCPFMCAFHLHV